MVYVVVGGILDIAGDLVEGTLDTDGVLVLDTDEVLVLGLVWILVVIGRIAEAMLLISV
jgi:hypothetical protein